MFVICFLYIFYDVAQTSRTINIIIFATISIICQHTYIMIAYQTCEIDLVNKLVLIYVWTDRQRKYDNLMNDHSLCPYNKSHKRFFSKAIAISSSYSADDTHLSCYFVTVTKHL